MVSVELLKQKLQENLNPTYLEVTDLSGACNGSFLIVVVTPGFEGKPLLQRHRIVNELLSEELKSIHALQLKTYTPEQWEKLNNEATK